MKNLKLLILMILALLPTLQAMDVPGGAFDPMEIDEVPELVRVKPRIQDIVFLQALRKGYYCTASEMINAGIGRSPLAVAQLHKPVVAEGVLLAAFQENHPGTINALIAVDVFPKEKWQELFDGCVSFMGDKLAQMELLILLNTHAGELISVNQKYPGRIETVLSKAAYHRLPNVVQALLKVRADINEIDNNGNTPLMHALGPGEKNEAQQEVIKFLLACPNIDLELKNKDGFNALITAVYGDNLFAVSELVAKGADINSQNNEGATPLIWSVWVNDEAIANLLLAHGADANLKVGSGWTALSYAQKSSDAKTRALVPLIEARMREQEKANK